ncbi:transmembrane protein 88B [Mergus octosetaceus]|uniref:Transmembrane protein 88B n=4 Tax=Anatidae TaxID=8830 RepID=A0A6J3E5S6_AYTFU|nr:transmembrane protein 88B [Anser cygnoides]XP_027299045.2 transmembrane protein 88B [Anas platyrhynchos]XP_032057197.1 transmembrane protein 88B [Aythya fuligula]XP_035413692.1 transmembrane protein 88B [Cygnus atratus]XP_040389618.1 transmembrane protein 88B [Cygnus olor]
MSDQETEDFGAESLLDKSKMIPSLPPYDMDDQLLPREPRSTWCCWAWALAIVTMNFLVFFINLLLLLVIFTVVLLPTIVVVYFGFQCHSRVLHSTARYCKTVLDDNSSSALIILGFVIMSPLIVVAMATYCSLARRLRLFMCFQPWSRAVYKGVKWRWYEEGGLCGCARGWNTQVKAWV